MTRDGDWGVPLPIPNTKGKVLYVWFDAPIGYISATKQWAIDNNKDWEPYWKDKDTKLIHFVGKDNIVFHCIIFPIMLKASGDYILPTDVPANEFLNLEGQKMSTSRRWSLEMYEYLEAMPDKVDELRYTLISNLPETKDSDFSWKDYQLKVNSELVAILGNMINRVFVLTHKFYDGIVPASTGCTELEMIINTQKSKVEQALETYSFREAMTETMFLARHANRILTEKEPWKMVKEDKEKAGIVLFDCFQIIANIAIMIEPFLPNTSEKIWTSLGMDTKMAWSDIGNVDMIGPENKISEPYYLFMKMEDEVINKQIAYLEAKTHQTIMSTEEIQTEEKKLKQMPEISFDDFSKMDIRIGEILTAEKVEGTDKLMKLSVDLGAEIRTIVSGVAHVFAPEEVIGKKVQVLVNLSPRKIKGIESKGMILFADHGDGLAFVTTDSTVANGSNVK